MRGVKSVAGACGLSRCSVTPLSFDRMAASALAMLAIALLPTAGHAGPTAEEICVATRMAATGRYAKCVAAARRAGAGNYYIHTAEALARCGDKLADAWERTEAAAVHAGTACPSIEDSKAIGGLEESCQISVLQSVRGGTLGLDSIACNDDLQTCSSELADCSESLSTCIAGCAASVKFPLRTAQATCFDSAGASIPCAGTGQDGELQKGTARSFTENGDGTFTDNVTGLMWERLSDDGSIHDKDDSYSWYGAFTSKIATLNAQSFAGFSDWRLPNLHELETLRDIGTGPTPVRQALSNSCSDGCSVLTCSCPTPQNSWSSSTAYGRPEWAWYVEVYGPGGGIASRFYKAQGKGARAVRTAG